MMHALDMQRARAFALARGLAARAPAGSIACIFAGGSLGRGEVWAAEVDGQLEVYSDVDLYVVVATPAALPAVRAAGAALRETTVDGARFLRAADVGVYTLETLRAEPVRPGTVDLSAHHLVLDGDAAIPAALPRYDPHRIAPGEALYLLENRALELDAVVPHLDAGMERMNLVRSLKARLDVHAAYAVADGTFGARHDQRAAALRTSPPASLKDPARREIAAAYEASGNLPAWLAGRDSTAEVERSLDLICDAWCALAPRVLAASGQPVSRLLERRWREGRRRENARELVRLRGPARAALWRVATAAPSLCSRSPRVALRMDAMVRRLHAQGRIDAVVYRRHRRGLDALTRAFGFTDGPQEKRVREMHRVVS